MIKVGKLYEIYGHHVEYVRPQFTFVFTPHTNVTSIIANSCVGTTHIPSISNPPIITTTAKTCGVHSGVYINNKFFINGTVCMVVQIYKIDIQQYALILVDDSLYAIAAEHIKELS